MNVEKIEKLEEILNLDKSKTILNQKIKRLTAPGENYGSLMLSLDITVQTPKGNEEIHTVAKLVPPSEFIQKAFNTQITFGNEIAFYEKIVPTLQNFQREQGMDKLIDFFPKFYGGRINLNGHPTKVDSDGALLLENLKLQNFANLERTVGFDLETAKLILVDLAHLHAVPLGLKLKKPEVFEDVKKHLFLPEMKESEVILQKFLKLLQSIDECRPYVSRVEETIRKMDRVSQAREPFATICHNDCWVNNTMVKVEEGKPVMNKLVDFQILDYGSPAKDVIFFLFSSVQNHVLKENCDDLIKFYHENFVQILRELKCDTSRFGFEAFLREIDIEAKKQFEHSAYMCFPIFAPRDQVKELSEFTEKDMLESFDSATDEHKEKLAFIVTEFVRRNWI